MRRCPVAPNHHVVGNPHHRAVHVAPSATLQAGAGSELRPLRQGTGLADSSAYTPKGTEMTMQQWRSSGLVLALAMVVGGCAESGFDLDETDLETLEDEPGDVGDLSQKGLLVDRNGFNVRNGLLTKNGLFTRNGVMQVGGLDTNLTVIPGLATIGGSATDPNNGNKSVDCWNKDESQCTGLPDGLFSNQTGLLRSGGDLALATYLVKCALPITKKLKVRLADGTLTTLSGKVGIAPDWNTQPCDRNCQERVSSCLIALTNGTGASVDVEFTTVYSPIGTSHNYRKQELVAYGNLFQQNPEAYVASGDSYSAHRALGRMGVMVMESGTHVETCEDGTSTSTSVSKFFSVPYVHTGDALPKKKSKCEIVITDADNSNAGVTIRKEFGRCAMASGTARSCTDLAGKTWSNPLTVWRNVDSSFSDLKSGPIRQ